MFDFTNISDHPSNPGQQVYRFYIQEQQAFFEELLIKNQIEYEKQEDSEEGYAMYFAVKKADVKGVNHLNYLAIGKFRKKFIPDPVARYFLISISILILGLAIVGFLLDTGN